MSPNPKEALDAGTRHLRNALTYSQPDGSPGSSGVTCERDRTRQQVALDDAVDDSGF